MDLGSQGACSEMPLRWLETLRDTGTVSCLATVDPDPQGACSETRPDGPRSPCAMGVAFGSPPPGGPCSSPFRGLPANVRSPRTKSPGRGGAAWSACPPSGALHS